MAGFPNTAPGVSSSSNTSGTAAQSNPVFTNGAVTQLAQTTKDSMIYIDITGAATGFAIQIGPTNAVPYALTQGAAPSVGSMYTVRLPAGWWIVLAATVGTWTSIAITC